MDMVRHSTDTPYLYISCQREIINKFIKLPLMLFIYHLLSTIGAEHKMICHTYLTHPSNALGVVVDDGVGAGDEVGGYADDVAEGYGALTRYGVVDVLAVHFGHGEVLGF